MSKAALSNGGGFLLTWQNADLTADGRAASQLALLLSWFKVAETFFKNVPDGFVRQIWPPFFSKQPGSLHHPICDHGGKSWLVKCIWNKRCQCKTINVFLRTARCMRMPTADLRNVSPQPVY